MRHKPLTAGELLAQLDADPEYQARQAQTEKARRDREEALSAAEEPLVNALHSVGLSVASVWDLVNTRAKYSEALPVLIENLSKPYPVEIREGIARALAVRESAHFWDRLVALYQRERDPRVHEGLALSLSEAAHDQVFAQVAALMTDPANGDDRLHFLGALKRMRSPAALELIQTLASDPLFHHEIQRYLRARDNRKRRT